MTESAIGWVFCVSSWVLALYALYRTDRIEKQVPKKVESIANKAYSKAQQALENSVEAVQIAKGEVPEKRNKPCNATFWIDGVEHTCRALKYPGHAEHSNMPPPVVIEIP